MTEIKMQNTCIRGDGNMHSLYMWSNKRLATDIDLNPSYTLRDSHDGRFSCMQVINISMICLALTCFGTALRGSRV